MPLAVRLASISPTLPSAEPSCPVSALAAEAAQVIRAIYAIAEPNNYLPKISADVPDLGYLFDDEDGPTPEAVRSKLRARVEAIAGFAQFRRAKSYKGAIFQLFLIGREAICLDSDLKLTDIDDRILHERGSRCEDLLYSALGPLQDDDEDLRILRTWFYPTEMEEAIRGETVLSELAARQPG